MEFGAGRSAAPPRVLWSGTESLNGEEAGASWSCPSETLAAAYETFTTAPEIRVGRIGHWRDLTHVNAGLTAPFEVRSLSWRNEAHLDSARLAALMPLHARPARSRW